MKSERPRHIYCCSKKPQVRRLLEPVLQSDEVALSFFSRCCSCLRKLSAGDCDILIVDLDGCEAEALEMLAQTRRTAPWISTMALVERSAVPTAVKAVRAGAHECLEKPIDEERLRELIAGQLAAVKPATRRRALTKTESQVLRLILAGRTSQDIALRLHRSKRTIDVHRKNIMRKLRVCSLVDLVKQAFVMGMGEEPQYDGIVRQFDGPCDSLGPPDGDGGPETRA